MKLRIGNSELGMELRILLCLALCVALPRVIEGQSPGDLAIVAHPDAPVTQLSLSELRQVLKGDRQYWKPDLPVVLFVRAATSQERTAVLGVIYQMLSLIHI